MLCGVGFRLDSVCLRVCCCVLMRHSTSSWTSSAHLFRCAANTIVSRTGTPRTTLFTSCSLTSCPKLFARPHSTHVIGTVSLLLTVVGRSCGILRVAACRLLPARLHCNRVVVRCQSQQRMQLVTSRSVKRDYTARRTGSELTGRRRGEGHTSRRKRRTGRVERAKEDALWSERYDGSVAGAAHNGGAREQRERDEASRWNRQEWQSGVRIDGCGVR